MIDKSGVVINLTASAVIAYMLISVFYLYVAVGENWNLVLNALLDNRVHGAISVSYTHLTLPTNREV